MPVSCGTRAYQQGSNLVISDEPSIDDAQASGRWVKSPDVCDLGVWR
jgi:hypothetical protein